MLLCVFTQMLKQLSLPRKVCVIIACNSHHQKMNFSKLQKEISIALKYRLLKHNVSLLFKTANYFVRIHHIYLFWLVLIYEHIKISHTCTFFPPKSCSAFFQSSSQHKLLSAWYLFYPLEISLPNLFFSFALILFLLLLFIILLLCILFFFSIILCYDITLGLLLQTGL